MNTFTFSPDEARRQARLLTLPICIVLGFAVVALLAGSYFMNPGITLGDFLSTCLMVLVIAGIVGFIAIRSSSKSAASLRITIGPDYITASRNGSKEITFRRAEVSKLIEILGQGLRIESAFSTTSIFIPKELTGFEQIKTLLSQWSPLQVEASSVLRISFIILGAAVMFGILMINKSTRTYGFALYYIVFIVLVIIGVVQSVRKFIARRRSPQV